MALCILPKDPKPFFSFLTSKSISFPNTGGKGLAKGRRQVSEACQEALSRLRDVQCQGEDRVHSLFLLVIGSCLFDIRISGSMNLTVSS